MKEYAGDYLEIGPSKPSGKWRNYTYVKIGAATLKDIYINDHFDVILRDQVKRRGHLKLWVINWAFKPMIIGITQDDGQTFRQSLARQYGFASLCIVITAGALLAWGGWTFLAPLSLLGAYFSIKLISTIKKIPADHIY